MKRLDQKYVPFTCEVCKKDFVIWYKHLYDRKTTQFCSPKCRSHTLKQRIITNCVSCGKQFEKRLKEKRRAWLTTNNDFCTIKCSSHFNNRLGNRFSSRSKPEDYLADKLAQDFPNLQIFRSVRTLFNLRREVDIFLPEIRIAIEVNGICHYRPIFGIEQLAKVKTHDQYKRKMLRRAGIRLITVPLRRRNQRQAIEFIDRFYVRYVYDRITEGAKRAYLAETEINNLHVVSTA